MTFVSRVLALLVLICCTATGGARAQNIYVPGPRIEIPSLSPQVAAQIAARERATRFVRYDSGPLYVLFDGRKLPATFPTDLTPARGRFFLDAFAKLAPSMRCRTDDVADGYVYLIQAAFLAYNGSHFETFTSGPVVSCGGTSFGAVSLSGSVHIYLGTPQFAAFPNRTKEVMYETLVALGGYLVDNAERAKPGSADLRKARADAADVIRSLTGFRAERVHLTGDGISIDDQFRP